MDRSLPSDHLEVFLKHYVKQAAMRAIARGINTEDALDLANEVVRVFLECLRAKSTAQLLPSDFRDCEDFVEKFKALKHSGNSVALFIYTKLSPQLRQKVDACNAANIPSRDLEFDLTRELNDILSQHRLDNEVEEPSSSLILTLTNDQGEKLLRHNRILLSTVFSLKIAKPRQEYDATIPAAAFFNSIASNLITHRSDSRNYSSEKSNVISLHESTEEGQQEEELQAMIPHPGAGPETIAPLRDSIERCKQRLKETQRRYVELHLSGYNYIEIASRLHVGQSAASTGVWRSMSAFRGCLEKQGVGLEDVKFA